MRVSLYPIRPCLATERKWVQLLADRLNLGALGLRDNSAMESGLDAGLAAGEVICPFITKGLGCPERTWLIVK